MSSSGRAEWVGGDEVELVRLEDGRLQATYRRVETPDEADSPISLLRRAATRLLHILATTGSLHDKAAVQRLSAGLATQPGHILHQLLDGLETMSHQSGLSASSAATTSTASSSWEGLSPPQLVAENLALRRELDFALRELNALRSLNITHSNLTHSNLTPASHTPNQPPFPN